jgi:arsenite methyltransferase
MPAPKFLLKQLSKPSGFLSPLTAWFLNKGNATQNSTTIEALPLKETSRVLDIGFGGGVSFAQLLRRCSKGYIAGVEVSNEMIQRAEKNWAREIATGQLDVREAGVDNLPWQNEAFDFVITVNTLYFWPDVLSGLSEIKRILTPGGLFASSCVPRKMLDSIGFPDMGFRTEEPEYYAKLLKRAGFEAVELISSNDKKGSKLILGRVSS